MSSSSSSENEYESIDNNDNEIGLKPYMFEPTKSKTVVEYDDISSSGESSSSEDEKKITRIGNNSWCLCGCCHAMQTSTESLCCREMSEICELRLSGHNCVTETDEFNEVCLKEIVLRVALVAINELRDGCKSDTIKNRNLRYAAYKQFTWWLHNRLGKGIRKVAPSCVVNKIRMIYPEENGIYVPFAEIDD